MLDTAIMKSLMSHDFFTLTREKLTPTLFADELRDLFKILVAAHKKYGHDLTKQELFVLWSLNNPVATRSERSDIDALLCDINAQTAFSADIAQDAIEALWRRDLGKRVANLGLEMAEGNLSAINELKRLIERHADSYLPDDYGPPTSDDIVELIKLVTDEGRWKFNLSTLSRHVYGIGPGEFGILFATPNTGKTAFVVSQSIGPQGFIDQGAKVLILGNEEATERSMVRACSAATGLSPHQILQDPIKARQLFRAKKQDRLIFKDTQDWTLDTIEGYVSKIRPDIIWIDQADKVQITGSFSAGHERLRELYRRLREAAKRHKCAIIGVSQASVDAEHKTRLSYTMMEGSKIGKAAEADLIIGIGRVTHETDDIIDPVRYLTVSKNKLSGWHGTIVCNLQTEVSRYVE